MEKSAIVKEVKENVRSFESKYGTMYVHLLTMDNGDSGEYSSKTTECKYGFGQPITYTIEQNGNYAAKIKPINTVATTGGGKPFTPKADDPEKQLMIVRQSCIGYAIQLYAAMPTKPELGSKPSDTIKIIAKDLVAFVIDGTKVQEINK